MAEILAPCGSAESLEAALRCGADAVYLGGEMFSARQNATNFTDDELEKAVYECHKRKAKVYLAINTVITDQQLEQCLAMVRRACEMGVDGLITQDLALIEMTEKCCPEMEIHGSTQMTVHTKRGALQAKDWGFSRVVLSRELPFNTIAEIALLPVETEVFVHGALCMSVSGQCFMSSVIGSRSANRGLCAQPCRLPMTTVRGKEDYALSLKDMCEIQWVKKLEQAGVDSLKIEGRMKRPEYVASAVTAYKQASEGKEYDLSLLESVFSRSGFTDGYINNKLGKDMFGIRRKEDVTATAKALPKLHELYRHEGKRSEISIFCRVKTDEPLRVTATDENGISVTVEGELPQQAKNRPCDEEHLKKQLSKLGDTIYRLKSFEADIEDGPAVSASQLNGLRREFTAKLDDKRAENFTKKIAFDKSKLSLDFSANNKKSPKIRVSVNRLNQLDGVDFNKVELVGIPLDLVKKALDKGVPTEKIAVLMPRFTFDEEKDFQKLKELAHLHMSRLICTNVAHLSMAKELGMKMHGGFGLNVTNSLSVKKLKDEGFEDITCSFELKSGQINKLTDILPRGIIGYGRLPLMLTVNCPVRNSVGCERCTGKLWDRTGREFPVKCSKNQGYVEILNSEVLYLADKLQDFNVDFVQLDFYDEKPEQVREIINMYQNGDKPKTDKLTRGLYYRGVK